MLNFVSRGHWSNTGGSKDFSVPGYFYFSFAPMALCWPIGCLVMLNSSVPNSSSHKFQQAPSMPSDKLCACPRSRFIRGDKSMDSFLVSKLVSLSSTAQVTGSFRASARGLPASQGHPLQATSGWILSALHSKILVTEGSAHWVYASSGGVHPDNFLAISWAGVTLLPNRFECQPWGKLLTFLVSSFLGYYVSTLRCSFWVVFCFLLKINSQ